MAPCMKPWRETNSWRDNRELEVDMSYVTSSSTINDSEEMRWKQARALLSPRVLTPIQSKNPSMLTRRRKSVSNLDCSWFASATEHNNININTACLGERTPSMSSSKKKNLCGFRVVPSTGLHFHFFRSSMLSMMWNESYKIVMDLVQKSLILMWMIVMAKLTLLWQARIDSQFEACLRAWAVFSLLEFIAVVCFHKECAFLRRLFQSHQPLKQEIEPVRVRRAPTLPCLNMGVLVTVLPCEDVQTKDDKTESETQYHSLQPRREQILAPFIPRRPMLDSVRRVVSNRSQPPLVNRVVGETRRRCDLSLTQCKIRVGKAHLAPYVGAQYQPVKPMDVYMIRFDGSRPDDKHMNPVVMWDITASFDECCALEHALKKEMQEKRLKKVTIPHLSRGMFVFVQRELNEHVLNARRRQLQSFLDEVKKYPELANGDAMRKFCQVK